MLGRPDMSYEVFAGDTLIGTSALELGDAPMGVAFGRMNPAAAYLRRLHAGPNRLDLRVRPVGGDFFQVHGGVLVVDESAELGADGLEVTIFGMGYPEYEECFPHHVRAYAEHFKE